MVAALKTRACCKCGRIEAGIPAVLLTSPVALDQSWGGAGRTSMVSFESWELCLFFSWRHGKDHSRSTLKMDGKCPVINTRPEKR